jgi:osmoprotectant transport system ATP-binding protein
MAIRREPVDGALMPEAGVAATVEFRQVTYRVGGNLILDNLNLSIEPGETLVLLGRSGSGKTTALKMVTGLLFPTSGEVRVDGRPTTEWDLIALRRGIGYVIQEVGLFPHFTVAQNVGLVPGLEAWPAERITARCRDLLQEVGLEPQQFLHRHPRELSGGQRQRVGVARALAAEPRLLLFDEPFGALDPVTRLELQDQFLALRRQLQKTSMFVSHDVREALRLGTRIALLDRGRLEVLATPQEFVKSWEPVTRTFLAVLDTDMEMDAGDLG